ncbi:YlbF/YmcA family competence regulator [Calditerricola satsumensis]|uniref:YlbF family regulator n=1 Tax=Calditerricola satsumensis TaxID=373054 RepID=A0A8J3B7R8_9BACI|nr:YlbF family regulator [Calditerricola satsumensis]GGJ95548.1 hypothetical protein GCM10007043_06730 [Calditerricola satsumensis]
MAKADAVVTAEDVLAKARELAAYLAQCEEVVRFRQAEERVKQNEKIRRITAEIRRKQKQATAFDHFQKPGLARQVDAEVAALLRQLDEIPLVQEYKALQADLNEVLQLITNVIAQTVSGTLDVKTGAD